MRGAYAALAALTLLCVGCAGTDLLGRRNALEEAQRSYTQRMRWGDIERASEYVHPDLRDAFLTYAPAFRDIRITDFEIHKVDFDDMSATVRVTYHAYSLSTALEKRIDETQKWERAGGNTWWVRPELQGLLDAFSRV